MSVFSTGLLAVINASSFGFGVLHQNYREFNNGLAPNIGPILDHEDGDISQFRYQTGGLYGHSGNFVATAGTGTLVALEPDSKTSQINYLLTLGRHW